jgi:hypothetical protein
MRHVPRLAFALTLTALAWAAPGARAQSNETYTYRDDDGEGRLIVRDQGPAPGVDGGSQIRVILEQDGRRFEGAGFRFQVTQGAPFTRLWAFTIGAPGRTYFFQGTTRIGIVPGTDGGGIYYPAGNPRNQEKWSIKEQLR